jgi:hypothetical protein
MQLIGTAFEYANISTQSARISNDMDKLLPLLQIHNVPADELNTLLESQRLLKKYHFSFSFTSFNKSFDNINISTK